MATDRSDTISTLNNLLETAVNAREGYRTAAKNVDNGELTTFFNLCAQERSNFAANLKRAVSTLGGTPDNSGTVAGAAHRGWITIRSKIAGGDAETLISECERGEQVAIEDYEDALKHNLPADLKEMLSQQLAQVRSDLKLLQNFKQKVA